MSTQEAIVLVVLILTMGTVMGINAWKGTGSWWG